MGNKFLVRRRLELNFLGEGWDQCFIEITPASPTELREILSRPTSEETTPAVALSNMDDSSQRLKMAFVAGRGLTAEGIVDLTADDLDDLPLEVTKRLNNLILGEVSPN